MSITLHAPLSVGRQVNVIWSNVALVAVVLIGVIAHSINMFGYPFYLGDEGIYMSQAYASARLGQITPYAYWYDHAPAGWILLGAWTTLTGGFSTFGTAVDSGRVFMLVLHAASLVLLFRVALRLTSNTAAATIACLLYTLSPLSIIYGRWVLLDNIMVFWALLAMVLMIRHDGRIWQLLYSGLCFGVAVLTKEVAIFLMPAFLYGLWKLVEAHQARFARAAWLFASLAVISLYFLYAALRKELIDFSFSSPLDGGSGSVTLFGAILWQMGRGDGMPWDSSSSFYQLLTTDWLLKDPWLLGLGAATTLWNLFRKDHRRRLVGLVSLMAIVSIARGSLVFDFYIIPLLPFLALNVVLALDDLMGLARNPVLPAAALVGLAVISYTNLERQPDVFSLKLTSAQRQALAWVQEHVHSNAQIVISDELWVDLRDGAPGKPSFPGAHSHWKVANDPAVYRDLYYDDWKNIDYIVSTRELEQAVNADRDSLAYEAFSQSTPVIRFAEGDLAVEIRKVNASGLAVKESVDDAYLAFRQRFIHDGQVRAEDGYTDARDQAAAMLMAVWMNDRVTFDKLWTWTRMHLQSDTGLLYETNEPGVELKSSSIADTDAALALLMAQKRWSDASYGRFGKEMVQAIWNNSVFEANGAPYLSAGDWAVDEEQGIVATGSFAPYAYHFFAEADPDHNWWWLLSNGYTLMSNLQDGTIEEGQSEVLPAYVAVNRETGELSFDPAGVPAQEHPFEDAAQIYWRVGLDAQWHDDERADEFLKASSMLREDWVRRGALAQQYGLDGAAEPEEASLTLYSKVLPKLMVEDPQVAHQVYATKIIAAFNRSQSAGHWGDGTNVAEQRWAWLTTGLYANVLEYQWEASK
jgi:endo-1,4-beta-D-glucanase Y/4-amino-4-deoxy-L-arabinose transferase-like glycosyltransferase